MLGGSRPHSTTLTFSSATVRSNKNSEPSVAAVTYSLPQYARTDNHKPLVGSMNLDSAALLSGGETILITVCV